MKIKPKISRTCASDANISYVGKRAAMTARRNPVSYNSASSTPSKPVIALVMPRSWVTVLVVVLTMSFYFVTNSSKLTPTVHAVDPCSFSECWPGDEDYVVPNSAAFSPSNNPIVRNTDLKPWAPPCNPGYTLCPSDPWVGLPSGTAAPLENMHFPNMGPSVAGLSQEGDPNNNPFDGVKTIDNGDSIEFKIKRLFNPLASPLPIGNDPPNLIVTGAPVTAVRDILHQAGMRNNFTNPAWMRVPDPNSDDGYNTICNDGSDATLDPLARALGGNNNDGLLPNLIRTASGVTSGHLMRGLVRNHTRYWPYSVDDEPATIIASSNESAAIGYSGSGHSLVDYNYAQDDILNKIVQYAPAAGYEVTGIHTYTINEDTGHVNNQVGPYNGDFGANPFGYEITVHKVH